ncbi:hypothetical protein [Opitutus sp. GAS368]|uniref:hypothetical protein n=1 Tax=Opitutus sp. GAS368 TaxID=1882749 RepID=UPI0012FE3021|nr:hypothetical protein [Opitutus sp. GAS368]
MLAAAGSIRAVEPNQDEVIDLGARRELMVDEFLIAQKSGLELRLHTPTPREIVMVRDAPWEGSGSDFETLIREGDLIRMYYIGNELTNADGTTLHQDPITARSREIYACYAESRDGIHWVRPELGLFEFHGSKRNNIVWSGPQLDNFTPFRDANPACPPEEKYKAMAAGPGGLFALKSADGTHWSYLAGNPVITRGKFDSQNNAFWDPLRGHYWCYLRDFHDRDGQPTNDTKTGIRDILVTTSTDFRTWSEPRRVQFGKAPDEALYINGIQPYARAPHLFVGFPARYVDRDFSPEAMRTLPDPEHRQRRMQFSHRYGSVVTDAMFMSSRDGVSFDRWGEAFIRPGPQRKNNWVYGDGFVGLGLIETPAEDPTTEPEFSLYIHEDHWKGPTRLRRHTLRIDGFVSLQARQSPGEFVTKPLRFSGRKLSVNFSTSAAGAIRVELLGADGRPLPGYSLKECDELFGDTLDRTVTWSGRSEIKVPAGQAVRLHMVLSDADLYSLQFQP